MGTSANNDINGNNNYFKCYEGYQVVIVDRGGKGKSNTTWFNLKDKPLKRLGLIILTLVLYLSLLVTKIETGIYEEDKEVDVELQVNNTE